MWKIAKYAGVMKIISRSRNVMSKISISNIM
jgi:hypothetical protein